MKRIVSCWMLYFLLLRAYGVDGQALERSWPVHADNGDGTYTNPVITRRLRQYESTLETVAFISSVNFLNSSTFGRKLH